MIFVYSLIMWFDFSFCLVYYTKSFFQPKYNLMKSFLISLIIHLPYSILSWYGTYLSYYHSSQEILLTIVGFIALIFLYVSRQIYLCFLTDAHFKGGLIFQFIYLFMNIIRLGFEDLTMFIGGIFLQSHQLVYLDLIYKIISLIALYYFTGVLYQNVNIIFFKMKTVFVFVLEFFFIQCLGAFESVLINLLAFVLNMILLSVLLKEIDRDYELRTYQETIDYQNQRISSMLEKQSQYNEILSKIRHDEKNHLLTLRLLYQQDPSQAKSYLQQWQKDIEEKRNANLYHEKQD